MGVGREGSSWTGLSKADTGFRGRHKGQVGKRSDIRGLAEGEAGRCERFWIVLDSKQEDRQPRHDEKGKTPTQHTLRSWESESRKEQGPVRNSEKKKRSRELCSKAG